MLKVHFLWSFITHWHFNKVKRSPLVLITCCCLFSQVQNISRLTETLSSHFLPHSSNAVDEHFTFLIISINWYQNQRGHNYAHFHVHICLSWDMSPCSNVQKALHSSHTACAAAPLWDGGLKVKRYTNAYCHSKCMTKFNLMLVINLETSTCTLIH